MKLNELVVGEVYSQGRRSQQFILLDNKMWHKYSEYVDGFGYQPRFGVGRNRSGRWTDAWGVPCLVSDRKGVPNTRYTEANPHIVNPKTFVGTWDEMEAYYKKVDEEVVKQREAEQARLAKEKENAKEVVNILNSLGVTAEISYLSTVSLHRSTMSNMLSVLTEGPIKKAGDMAAQAIAEYQQAKDQEVAEFRERMVETVKDLLYELDVTWDEWFSGKEVVL